MIKQRVTCNLVCDVQVAPVDVLENEEESIAAKTKDGSLDWHGRPAIKVQTGGWGCAVMILGILDGFQEIQM